MPQFRCHKIVLVLLVVISPLFFWGGAGGHSARMLQEFSNFGHVFFFFLLTLYLCFRGGDSQVNMSRRFLICILVTVLLGGVIELLQLHLPGRSSSVADFARDISGLIIALSVVIIKESSSTIVRLMSIVSGLAILAISSFSLVAAVQDEISAWRDFPLLSGFEHTGELLRWDSNAAELSRVGDRARTGQHSLKVVFSTARYSALSLVHFPHDWRGYDWLVFSVYNPAEPLILHFRVHDRSHRERRHYDNRYNGSTLLGVGWNDIKISMEEIRGGPRSRVMDLADIQAVGIFVTKQKEQKVLYLDDLRLE